MQLNLGENLRAFRRMKGMTQEQVAEAVGVSAQAVSRWENDSSYPDVVMLTGLAMLYETSVDTLVGMEELRSAGALRQIHGMVHEMMAQGRCEEAETLIRDSLRLYPDNPGLLMALGETLAQGDKLQEAIATEERILTMREISMKARSTAMVNLLYLYRKTGAQQKIQAMVRELPHIWESREIMLAEVDRQRGQAVGQAIHKALVMLCGMIDRVDEDAAIPAHVQLGMDFDQKADEQSMLAKIGQFLAQQNEVN